MSGRLSDWYEVAPQTPDAPGVILLHSAWGLTACHRQMCDRLAAIGCRVVAPDLYGGATADTWEEAQRLRTQRRTSDRWSAIARATSHLQRSTGRRRPIGVVGLSMGGHWALFLAQRGEIPVAATVVFCAVRGGDYRDSQSAFQFHLAAEDEYVSPIRVQKLRGKLEAVNRPANFYTYEGTQHWFCDQERPQSYDENAAELAWARTEAFVQHHLPPHGATPLAG